MSKAQQINGLTIYAEKRKPSNKCAGSPSLMSSQPIPILVKPGISNRSAVKIMLYFKLRTENYVAASRQRYPFMIALLCAVPIESKLLRASITTEESLTLGSKIFIRGRLSGREAVLCAGGMG